MTCPCGRSEGAGGRPDQQPPARPWTRGDGAACKRSEDAPAAHVRAPQGPAGGAQPSLLISTWTNSTGGRLLVRVPDRFRTEATCQL